MKNQNFRIQTFDVLKAIAILAVVYTHCLQFMGIGHYWHHPIFKLTYAFHMPLFMVISGYFAQRALQLPLKELIQKKSIQLI
jgi:fucose 4-O-acetylase-like acetyltransferase